MSLTTLYAVVHLRFKGENRHREVQKTISERWFNNLPDAKAAFQKTRTGMFEMSIDPSGESHKWDSKQLYKLELNAKAKSFSAKNPRCDAEWLANELNLNATAGELLVEDSPSKHHSRVPSSGVRYGGASRTS
jgi:hypothetical protein